MQIGYQITKWQMTKDIDLKVGVPAFILGQNLTPQQIYTQNKNQISRTNNNLQLQFSQSSPCGSKDKQDDQTVHKIQYKKEIITKCFDEHETETQRKNKSKMMLQIYLNTILFTYRKNFFPLLDQIEGNPQINKLTSDAGWGCMIRAGQMILAQALKKHLKKQTYVDSHQLGNIIFGFLENDEQETHPFSIHQITKFAFQKYKYLPGQWYTPVSICHILKDLHKETKLKGTDNLKISVHGSDKPIIFENILNTLSITKIYTTCNHQNVVENSSSENQLDSDEDDDLQNYDDKSENLCCLQCCSTKNSLLLFIPCKLGIDEICSDHQEIIKRLLSLESSIGMIGGKPKYAHYFLGYIGNQLVYLDPHWINESQKSDTYIQHLQSFFSSEVHQMPLNKLNTSVVFGFYFNNLEELNSFYLQLRQLGKEYGDNFFLVIEKERPMYDYSYQSELKKYSADLVEKETKQKHKGNRFDQSFENYDGALEDDCDDEDKEEYQNQQNFDEKQGQYDYRDIKECYLKNSLEQQLENQYDTNSENQQKEQYNNSGNINLNKASMSKSQSDEDLQRLKDLYYQNSHPQNELNDKNNN